MSASDNNSSEHDLRAFGRVKMSILMALVLMHPDDRLLGGGIMWLFGITTNLLGVGESIRGFIGRSCACVWSGHSIGRHYHTFLKGNK